MRRIVKLEDLADLAGCSVATASRALSRKSVVRPATRKRILDLAREHDFPLHKYDVDQKAQHATIVAVVPRLPSRPARLRDPFIQEFLAYLGEAASDIKCDLRISHTSPVDGDELNGLLDHTRADGIVFIGQGLLHPLFNEMAETRNDFIVWGAKMDDQRYPTIGSDNFLGGWKAARHLLQSGRKNLHFFGDITGPEMRHRYAGFCSALGLEVEAESSLVRCNLDVESAAASLQQLVLSKTAIDGIVAVNDVVAVGLLKCLHVLKRRVPDEIAVVGYDDVEFCHYTQPSLSSISQNVSRAGKLVISNLFMDKKRPLLQQVLTTDLIVRDSSSH
jgi:DNA-binding LacI/PurR family transcriptional regulator